MGISDRQIILDESSENLPSEDFVVVRTEIEFLQNDGVERLWVSGQPCQYVRSIYKSRNIQVTDLVPPRSKLRVLAGNAGDKVSYSVLKRSIKIIELDNPQTLGELLFRLTNDEFWSMPPSLHHAARYLIIDIQADLVELCNAQRKLWLKSNPYPELVKIYRSSFEERGERLRDWLLDNATRRKLGEFPLSLTGTNAETLSAELGQQLRSSKGEVIAQFPKQTPNRNIYGQALVEYFSHNRNRLSSDLIAAISSLLSGDQRLILEGLLPQSEIGPIAITAEVGQVITWATDKYLPLRASKTDAHKCDDTDHLAGSFADWLLENYPKLTNTDREESSINIRTFYTVRRLASERWVLWVVVDGLSFINHQKLIRLIGEKSCQLRPAENVPLLAVLPTITEKAKYGLTTGKFPRENPNFDWNIRNKFLEAFPNGVYAGTSGMATLADGLRREAPTICYWNYTKIDKCYHENTDLGFLNTEVDGHLQSLAIHIDQMVSKAHDSNMVSVVICSDHGQLTSRCNKLQVDLDGDRAHGRTVIVSQGKEFSCPDSAYVKNSDGETVDLNPTSFRLSEQVTVALRSTYFVDLKATDLEEAIGVHGGLYPEEVIVGMAVLTRQPVHKTITAKVRGEGETGRPGTLLLSIDNPNPLILNPLSIAIDGLKLGGQGELLLAKVAPHETLEFEIPVDQFPQPTNEDEFVASGVMHFEFGDGHRETCPLTGILACKSLYKPQNPSLLDRFKK